MQAVSPSWSPSAAPGVRREDEALLRGLGCFVHDVRLPDTCHVAFVRSAHAHARLLSIDGAPARALPGVLAVLTAADLGDQCMPDINPLLAELAPTDFPLLPRQRVTYVGQPIAMVIARSHALACQAAALVGLEVQALTPELDFAAPAQASPVARTAHGSPEPTQPTRPMQLSVQAKLQLPRVLAVALEPRACLARWDAQQARLTLWLGSQSPSRAQADVVGTLGLDLAQVRVICPDVGGAFGAKASVCPEELLVALAARHLGGTLRWASSRLEDFSAGMHGRGARLSGTLTLDAAGDFQALSARLDFPLGAWLAFSALVPLRNAARVLPGPYRVARLDLQGQASRSHTAPVNIYRGAGRPEAALLMETLIDQAARASGMDPVALRQRNLIRAADMPWRSATGELLDSGDYLRTLERACARFDYPAERASQAARRAAGECVGIGVAMYLEPCGQGWESARVTLHADGRVTVASGSPDQGQGHASTFAQIAATELGCPVQAVEVLLGDTDTCPAGIGALASRSTAIGGSAIAQACREARSRRQGGEALPLTAQARFTAAEAWSHGCVMARMAVDAETGEPRIERLVWVDDAGHIINPVLARGQLLGGAAQGLGQAMMERMVYDANGQPITGSLMDYALPRASDMPAIEIESLCSPSPHNLLGAKGVGEAGCIGVPAALMNAARDALQAFGEPELQLPLTAEQLWRAMTFASISHSQPSKAQPDEI